MSAHFDRFKDFYNHNPWKARLVLSLFVIFLFLIVIRIALSPGIIYGATSWLKQQGIDSSIESINIDIFDGTISLINAKGSRNEKPLFNVGLVEIDWMWMPLSKKTIEVIRVRLDQFNVNIKQYADQIIIGGVHIPLNAEATDKELNQGNNEEIAPWAAALGEVIFSNLNICYLLDSANYSKSDDSTRQLDYCIDLEKMEWGGTISYATDKALLNTDDLPLSSSGNFILNGLTVTDNKLNKYLLSSTSNTLKNVNISGLNNIHIDELSMNSLSALQRDDKEHIDAVRFAQLTIDNIDFSNLNALSLNTISLSQPGLYLVKINEEGWEYQQWLAVSSDAPTPKNDEAVVPNNKPAETLTIAINNITVNDSDFCYQEKMISLYYCFTLEQLNWEGSLNYDSLATKTSGLNLAANGNLSLSHPKIRNQTIERNLLDFKLLALNNINITDGSNVTIDNLLLDDFSALQRGSKQDDYTAYFTNLTIDSINYAKNKLAINTIQLNGLSNTVSKNKNGEWEHNKWLIKSDKQAVEAKASATKNKTDESEPLLISLNKLSVNSNKEMLFTDNSTEPAMTIGLNKLVFDISKLTADKPDTDSPFKLHANTTRHSTVDLEGSVRPFAEKVSIDANGKLKGFDLRTATPATQKAIGHIIKSGQLDADLQLKAIEGVLDSNVALSLYHFNIKPMSDADAKKLDDKFGMPLNKTLILLRNKDDSIHLDIPITGDINNPEFNPMDAIIKATSKAATVTLITFYTPYGLVYAGGNVLFDLATAMNFDPIIFKAGAAELLDENKAQLDNLAKLLTEKPQVHLTLCGVTNNEDTKTLYPDSIKQEKDKVTVAPLSEKQTANLTKLAQERQVNVKNYLIKGSGVTHDRLILCSPEHKTEEGSVAGVEINF